MNSFLTQIAAIIGTENLLVGDLEAYELDWRKKFRGRALAVAKPKTTEQVSQIVKLCFQEAVAIVPQGGNTGLVGGATPDQSGTQLILNLSRMNQIIEVDLLNNTMTVEAGCILQNIQTAAADKDRLFPLSLAAEGSCEIGGNISTNAGGVQVLRYGNTRELVLGLEVVLPNGTVLPLLTGLRKDNTGYDLKQLFIGAEGTLGIVTKAVLKLFARPTANTTAWVAVASPDKALALLKLMQARHAESLSAFELVSRLSHEIVLKHFPTLREPLTNISPWYVLLELSDTGSQTNQREQVEETLGVALEQVLATDCVIAQSESESQSLWALRENITEAQVQEGKNIKHDVSVPISTIARFIQLTDEALDRVYPGVRPVTFGHLGDGNLHYNISPPVQGWTEARWLLEWDNVNQIVHRQVQHFQGSISAEHGIGQLKKIELAKHKSEAALNLMAVIKAGIDPKGIMNPGKILTS
jgi:FAD/FMN-containing dehydrogenase